VATAPNRMKKVLSMVFMDSLLIAVSISVNLRGIDPRQEYPFLVRGGTDSELNRRNRHKARKRKFLDPIERSGRRQDHLGKRTERPLRPLLRLGQPRRRAADNRFLDMISGHTGQGGEWNGKGGRGRWDFRYLKLFRSRGQD
jgi:hypothetical protein